MIIHGKQAWRVGLARSKSLREGFIIMDRRELELKRELEQAALLGDLARPLVHECNNFLNNLLLQIALIEEEAPEPLRTQLAGISKEGRDLAKILEEWQRFCPGVAARAEKASIHKLLQDAISDLCQEPSSSAESIELVLGPELEVQTQSVEVKRLLFYLLKYVITHRGPGTVMIQTRRAEGKFRLEISAPGMAWSDCFKPGDLPAGSPNLVRLACKALAHRLQASLVVQDLAEESVLVIELPDHSQRTGSGQ
jgi:signal transduction histidine kinase